MLSDSAKNYLRRVREIILNEEKFNWSVFLSEDDASITDYMDTLDKKGCGTNACIAGWLCILYLNDTEIIRKDTQLRNIYVPTIAMQSLSIEDAEEIEDFLFYPWSWYDKNDNKVSRYKIFQHHTDSVLEAIARIDWLLEDKPIEEYAIQQPILIY